MTDKTEKNTVASPLDYEKLTGNKTDPNVKLLTKIFKQGGVVVVSSDLGKPKRTLGITNRELKLIMQDNQTVSLLIKATGDIFKVKLNNKEFPIKEQNDLKKAILEVAKKLQSGALQFQKKQLKLAQKLEAPKGMKSTVRKTVKYLKEKLTEINEQIKEAKDEFEKASSELEKLTA